MDRKVVGGLEAVKHFFIFLSITKRIITPKNDFAIEKWKFCENFFKKS
jgi:hypothetical protein